MSVETFRLRIKNDSNHDLLTVVTSPFGEGRLDVDANSTTQIRVRKGTKVLTAWKQQNNTLFTTEQVDIDGNTEVLIGGVSAVGLSAPAASATAQSGAGVVSTSQAP